MGTGDNILWSEIGKLMTTLFQSFERNIPPRTPNTFGINLLFLWLNRITTLDKAN